MKPLQSSKGFTLIELLVVVSIIALLVSILLPALGKAREQGKAVVCSTHLNSIGYAFFYFSQERGKFPCQQTEYYNNYWTSLIAPYIDPTDPKLHCPSSKPFAFWEFDANLPDAQRKKLTYTYNTWLGLAEKQNELSPELVLLGDGKGFHSWSYNHVNYRVATASLAFPHGRKNSTNLLFFDNHVVCVKQENVRWQWFNPDGSTGKHPWYGATW